MKSKTIVKVIITVVASTLFVLLGISVAASVEESRPDVIEMGVQEDPYVRSNVACEILEKHMQVSAGEPYTIWEDYYGGGWFSEDGLLHVYLTDLNVKEELVSLLGEYADAVVFLKSEHSLNEMHIIAETVAAELIEEGIRVSARGVDEINQKAFVGVIVEDVEKAETYIRMKSNEADNIEIKPMGYFDLQIGEEDSDRDETIEPAQLKPYSYFFDVFELSSNGIKSNMTTVLKGADKIMSSGCSMSLGICGRYNGNNCLVTCGHGLGNGYTITSSSGTMIGNVVHHSYSNNANGDYSIVKITNTYFAPSYYVKTTPLYKAYSSHNHNGKNVIIKGYVTSNNNVHGTVIASDVTVTSVCNNVQITINGVNVCQLSGSAVTMSGDSGGTYYYGNTFYGVHNGSDSSSGVNYTTYTPYCLFNSIGFTIYPHSHNYNYTDYNATYHKCTCTLCGYYFMQEHSLTWDYDNNCCIMCGHHD